MSAALPAQSRAAVPSRVREVIVLALPAVVSYTLNNFYRINDQFWVQGLGGAAQAAIGANMYVAIMNFALFFLAGVGTLAMVSRAAGARDARERDAWARHALILAVTIGLAATAVGGSLAPAIVDLMGLEGEVATQARAYLVVLYLVSVPMALAPALDHIFIARGNTWIPMVLLCLAIAVNFVLNPVLIYGARAAELMDVPGVGLLAALAEHFGFDGFGIGGAALATGLSRIFTTSLGLLVLRFGFGLHLVGRRVTDRIQVWRFARIVRISAPVSFSIAIYAGVYWGLLGLVLARLDDAVVAGLGLGFQVFEGLAFPCFLGVGTACASLVGRSLGARDPAGALEAVRSARLVGRALAVAASLGFWFVAPHLIPFFTQDPDVARETATYVFVLAFSQFFVATESVNEKALMGSGYTRPIMLISVLGNLARLPLAWLLALALDLGAAGVWWAINLTTVAKALALRHEVQRGRWLAPGHDPGQDPEPRDLAPAGD